MPVSPAGLPPADAVEAALRAAGVDLDLRQARMSRLPSVSNRALRVEAAGQDLAVRLGVGAPEILPRTAEAEASARAAAQGIGPAVVACAGPVLVTRFRAQARPLSRGDLGDPRRLRRCAELLRRVHDGGPWAHGGRVGAEWVTYLAAAPDHPLTAAMARLRGEVEAVDRRLAAALPALRPCHVDPSVANWLVEGDRLLLLDWEYAANGDPLWDLADLAEDARLAHADRYALVDAWCGGPPPLPVLARFEAQRLMVRWTWAAWGLAMAGETGDASLLDLARESLSAAEGILRSEDLAAHLPWLTGGPPAP